MLWASSVSQIADPGSAAQDLLRQLRAALGDARPDFLFLFVSPAYGNGLPALVETLQLGLHPRQWGAVTARGVIGAGQEIEDGLCVSAVAAVLPDVEVQGRHLSHGSVPDPDAPPGAWVKALGIEPTPRPNFLLMADPFGDPEPLLSGLDYAFPGCPLVGGLLSGGQRVGQNRLIWNGRVFAGGALLLAFSGNIRFETVVAQGCRPIGPEAVITSLGSPNLIVGLNGETPLAFLERLDQSLSPADRTLLREALFLGIAVPEDGPKADGNAYLIRNLMDVDHTRGGLWIGARLEEGMRVRFHLRDHAASRDDLSRLLDLSSGTTLQPPRAALMFSCLGRGTHLYGQPHHDVKLVGAKIPDVPVAGFFCSGEIGPVAGQSLLHGYTAALALVRPLAG